MVRACAVWRRIALLRDRQGANLEEWGLAAVGSDDALAEPTIGIVADRLPRGLARQGQAAVAGALRTGVSRWNQRQRFAAVLELQLRRHPHEIAQINWRLERDCTETRERHPVVATVDNRFHHRTKPRISVGNPLERCAIEAATRCRRLFECAL